VNAQPEITDSMEEILNFIDEAMREMKSISQIAVYLGLKRRWKENFENQCRKLEVLGFVERKHVSGKGWVFT